MAELRGAGRRLALISLEDDPPPFVRDVVTYHLSPSATASQRLSDTAYSADEALQAAGLVRLTPIDDRPRGPTVVKNPVTA